MRRRPADRRRSLVGGRAGSPRLRRRRRRRRPPTGRRHRRHRGRRHRPPPVPTRRPTPRPTAPTGLHARRRHADGRHRRAGVPALRHRRRTRDGQGFEAAVAYAVAEQMGFTGDAVDVGAHHVRRGDPARPEGLRLQPPAVLDHPGARARSSTSATRTTRATRRSSASPTPPPPAPTTIADLQDAQDRRRQAGTTSLDFVTDVIQPDTEPFVYNDNAGAKAALDTNQIDADRRRPADGALHHGRRDRGQQRGRPVPAAAGGTTDELRAAVRQGQPARRVRQRRPRRR